MGGGMIFENIVIAVKGLWANKLRSLLTLLGILIGVASVIAVVSIVQGFFFAVNNVFQDLGAGWVRITSYRPPGEEGEKLGRIRLTRADAEALVASGHEIRDVAPVMFGFETVKYGDRSVSTTVAGTAANYQEIVGFYAGSGRFFTGIDDSHRRKVCVMGWKVARDLDLPTDPVGTRITIGGEEFMVVGMMEERGELIGLSLDNFVFVPYGTTRSLFGEESEGNTFLEVAVSSPERLELARGQIINVLRRSHRLKPDQPDDFRIVAQEQIIGVVDKISGISTYVAAGVAGVALFVGGIGIMNIMLVSVTERTREIGVRKAVGARRVNILLQFLIEATVLTLVGGTLGVIIGIAVGKAAASVIPNFPSAHVPVWAIVAGLGVSAFVGVVFGVFPAARASRLDPIDALRYE
ncbi:MAG TPA: ABC transporter permease [Candidatus Saccharimonadales bacterium]|nr:ABC transporter permease [Candidatus Saccharimonadales bacterium]